MDMTFIRLTVVRNLPEYFVPTWGLLCSMLFISVSVCTNILVGCGVEVLSPRSIF